VVNRYPEQGTIITGGPAYPLAKGGLGTVEAVRIDGGRITHVGSLAGARALGDAQVVDLDGRSILPGFVDAHTHPLMHGQCASWADLTSAASIDEVVKLLGEHARTEARSIGPIRGFGYDHHRLAEGRHPTAVELDLVADNRTVTAMHVSGHGFSVNSHGLAEAGITAAAPTPPGGVIDRDEDGRPIGRVFDAACDLLTGPDGVKLGNHGPNLHLPDDPDDLASMLDDAQEAFLAAGITTVGDCQVTEREMRAFLAARDAGRLALRVVMYVLSTAWTAWGSSRGWGTTACRSAESSTMPTVP
jgi:predicted amidohydrolase YtcJ